MRRESVENDGLRSAPSAAPTVEPVTAPNRLLALQRMAGNQAVAGLIQLRCGGEQRAEAGARDLHPADGLRGRREGADDLSVARDPPAVAPPLQRTSTTQPERGVAPQHAFVQRKPPGAKPEAKPSVPKFGELPSRRAPTSAVDAKSAIDCACAPAALSPEALTTVQRALEKTVASTLVQRQTRPQTVDVDIETVSPEEAARLRQRGINLPAVSAATTGASPYTGALPGYSQLGDTCGAASLVTALMIWDREHWDPNQPNSRVVTACNLILAEFALTRSAAIERWATIPAASVSRRCGGDHDRIREEYAKTAQDVETALGVIRDVGRQRGAAITELDYQQLGIALYFLWHEGGQGGLSTTQIFNMRTTLGLQPTGVQPPGKIQSFGEIFTHPITIGLQPGQIAQVNWITNTGFLHMFLVGRLRSSEWFLSDQGPSPAVKFQAPTPNDLAQKVQTATGYWLYKGTLQQATAQSLPGSIATGVTLLAGDDGTETKAQTLIPAGAFLCAVDAGVLTTGDRVTCDAFVSRSYSLAEAQSGLRTSTGGGVIVELPQGVFSLYTTSAVSNANVIQTVLDAGDSAGGYLTGHRFLRAWLILGTSAGRRGSWFQIY